LLAFLALAEDSRRATALLGQLLQIGIDELDVVEARLDYVQDHALPRFARPHVVNSQPVISMESWRFDSEGVSAHFLDGADSLSIQRLDAAPNSNRVIVKGSALLDHRISSSAGAPVIGWRQAGLATSISNDHTTAFFSASLARSSWGRWPSLRSFFGFLPFRALFLLVFVTHIDLFSPRTS
jgi:hypothetical protein